MNLDDLIKYMEDIKSEIEIETNQDLISLVTRTLRRNEIRLWVFSESLKKKKNVSDPSLTRIDLIIKHLVISRIELLIESSNAIACSIGYQEYKGTFIKYPQSIDELKSHLNEDWVQFFIILRMPSIENWKSFSDH
jgi:hypothetical protein